MSQLLLSALAVVCPDCDGYNPPRAEVCASCGTSLVEESPTAKPLPTRASPATAAGRPASAPGVSRTPPGAPPGLRPSSRTPPPIASAGIPVAAARPPSVPSGATARGPAPTQPVVRPVAPGGAVPPAMAPRPGTAAPSGARAAPAASRFGLAVIAGTARGQRFKLPLTGCTVGRSRGAILFADDVFVSAQHATFSIKEGALHIRDESSASGVYVTVPGSESLPPHSFFSVGQRLFRYLGKLEAPPALAGRPTVYGAPVPPGQGLYAVEEVLVGGRSGRVVVTSSSLLTIGQANCDFSYPQEEGLASRHCELSPSPAGALLRDLSGGLGTYVRLAPMVERQLRPGDRVRLGQHLLQVELVG